MSWYRFFQTLLWVGSKFIVHVRVEGKGNIPRRGPFILLGNHVSVLDPILVQISCPRPLNTFTKSTQFQSRFMRWALPRVKAIPTRRYRVDPQVVRVALRLLGRGEAVGIYPEGERSWDGSLQPLRLGTVRLILKAGVPVIPCRIEGTYDVWPRWSKKIRKGDVTIRFGRPLYLGIHDRREDRERELAGAMAKIRTALEGSTAPSEGRGESEGR